MASLSYTRIKPFLHHHQPTLPSNEVAQALQESPLNPLYSHVMPLQLLISYIQLVVPAISLHLLLGLDQLTINSTSPSFTLARAAVTFSDSIAFAAFLSFSLFNLFRSSSTTASSNLPSCQFVHESRGGQLTFVIWSTVCELSISSCPEGGGLLAHFHDNVSLCDCPSWTWCYWCHIVYVYSWNRSI